MMDSKPILPDMFHPQQPSRTRDSKRFIRPFTRTARPVKYYYTDFGLSRRYSPEDTNPLEVPIMGGDKTVPEFLKDPTVPRNPFHTDVYYIGNLIRRDFLEVCQPCIGCRGDIDTSCSAGIQEFCVHGAIDRPYGPGCAGQAPHYGRSCRGVSRDNV